MNYTNFLLSAFSIFTMLASFPANAGINGGYSLTEEEAGFSDEKAHPLKELGNGPVLGALADSSRHSTKDAYLAGEKDGFQNPGKRFLKRNEDSGEDSRRRLRVVSRPLSAPDIRNMSPDVSLSLPYPRESSRRTCPRGMYSRDDYVDSYLRRKPVDRWPAEKGGC